ncbi:very long chain fatty acid elongase 5 [Takifugu rubripes]|uniref:Elongation of very long chain fatty acids protein n=1 Tax=Takifugu rubripes TaxID=31033 RepID=H2UNL7_TAKRU|nr:elongation of very long chain fatty acids protein 5 [Takifugu rubripes]XP_029690834.1 elongation of very long chain fatty acids protein 5 [Takifugu rubripes]XP_029690835.1 elongation of very long chain fatty acids protein 5 [Takifugu rubripes]|eukprot:XP_003964216.1 PREDICTED: elongation of very long chain fatty acids protein 5 [Takifugu rubripes]
MDAFNQRLNAHFEAWLGPRDKRVRGMLLLDGYLPTLALTLGYLLVVWMGPRYMKHRQPYSCRGAMMLYNLGITILSFGMFSELVAAVWPGDYDFYCQSTHGPQEVDKKIINILWWYYFSKLLEFMDTFFFILRKNNHQVTFLHVYHHISMLNIWWFVMNWIPCGHSFFGPTLNCFVHVVMYSYYGLSAIPAVRPYLWWKKHITQLQLIQFGLTVFHALCAVVWPCGFSLGWLYFQISYMVSLVIFFLNFYTQTYKKHKASLKKDHQSGSTAFKNGHAKADPAPALKKRRVD